MEDRVVQYFILHPLEVIYQGSGFIFMDMQYNKYETERVVTQSEIETMVIQVKYMVGLKISWDRYTSYFVQH